ncbi:MAG: S41 family peptidase [candidate division Zixibacteria bacterium]|nr:S41 family peptidase [candidate division Zixibacteria bacterium]
MNSEINVKFYAVMLTVVVLAMIWMVGEGDASQTALQDVIYRQSMFVQEAAAAPQEDPADKPKHSLAYYTKLMADIAYKIHTRYMEDVDPQDLIEAGIEGMLEDLDPYSVVLKKKSYDMLMENTHGKYEGVGMQIDLREGWVTIISPIEGTPAYRLGLQAGDKIVKIDSISAEGMSTQEAASLMRGPAGTMVILTIRRPGIDELLEYDVERAVIELHSVRYYGMVEDDIGYVRIDKFSEQTTHELTDAIVDMKENMGARSLILDLRSNGGGLLDQAINVANLFLPKGKLIVYTQGKYPTSQQKFHGRQEPVFADGELIVLVNGGTASASEIVSGAIQDWDRGVIVGTPTFGKGLVQRVFGGQGSDIALKLTTAKYYIPSGRCIQKPEGAKKHPEPVETDPALIDTDEKEIDTEAEVFLTAVGREVYGGGGINPDVEEKAERWKPIEYNLIRKNMFFEFAIDYSTNHADILKDFEVDDNLLDEFRRFIKEKDFTYKTALEYDLEKFEETAEKLETLDAFADEIADLRSLIEKEKEKDFQESEKYIRQSIKREILRKAWGERGVYEELTLKEDKTIRTAVDLLKDKKKYSKLLKPGEDQG